MDEVATRIKGYVKIIRPNINDDDLLDFIVADVIDRALVFMNRVQLLAQYEEDLDDENVEEEDYVLPIPRQIERTLASVVVGVFRTMDARNTATTGAIKSISDNGQSITYSEQLTSFLSSSSDTDIFSGSTELLKRYILPTIFEDTCRI